MLDACSGIRIKPTEEALQSLRDTSPFQDREDPSVIYACVGAGEVSMQDAWFFTVARSQCDRGSLYLKDFVNHNALGNTSSVRVDTLNRVSSWTLSTWPQ